MASLTRSQLKSSSNTTYTTNGVGDIDASEVRTFNDNLIESLITNDLTSSMNVLNSVSASYATIAGGVVGGIPSLASLNAFTSSQDTKNSTLASYTASNDSTNTAQNSRLTNLESTSASVNTSIANLNTFSASNGNTSLNSFTSSANGRLTSLESQTSSYANSSSVATVDAAQQSQINALIAATSSYATGSVSLTSLNDFTSSQNTKNTTLASYTGSNDTKWNTLGGQTGSYVTSAITASSLVTASVNLNTITFTKGDASTFNITVNTGSGTTTDLTSLNSFTSSQDTKNLAVGYSTSSLNSFTSSNANTSLNSYTTSVDSKFTAVGASTSSLNSATASLFSSASLGLTTASFSGNTLTFTKGNGTTFGVVIPDVSGSTIPTGTVSGSAQIVELGFLQTSSFNSYTSSTNSSITQLNASSASQQISIDALNNNSGSVNSSITQLNASSASQQVSINALNNNSGSVNSSITQLNASSASQQVSINALNAATSSYVTSAITASSLITASFSGNTLTFTKGDSSTFGVVIPDVSGSTINTGSFVTTASFNAYTTSQDTKNSTLATYTGSNDTKWSTISTVTSSLIAYTGSNDTKWSNLGSQSGSFVTESETGSFVKLDVANIFTQPQRINYSDGTGSLFTTDRIQTELSSTKESGYRLKNQFGTSVVEMGQDNGGDSSGFIIVRSASNALTATIGKNGFEGRVDTTQFTASLAEGYVFVGDGSGKTSLVATSSFGGGSVPTGTVSSSAQITALGFVSSSVTASSLVTASFSGNTLTFTKGDSSTFGVVIPDVSGSTINTGSFATTGSNLFIGDETFSNTDGNGTTLTSFSGSLVFTPKAGFASSSSLQNHLFISASATGQTSITNIIFNTLAQGSPTGSIIISGSNNIFPISTTNTAGFQRRINNGNLALGSNTLPQFTSSMSNVPVSYGNNIHLNGTPTFRGPISSSTYTFAGNILGGNPQLGDGTESMISASAGINFQGNFFVAGKLFRASKTQLSASVNATSNVFGNASFLTSLNSSSITYTTNLFYGGAGNLVNNYYAPSASANNQRVEFQYNLVGGQSTQFFISGSNTTTTFNRQINNNFVGGNFCQVSSSLNGDNSSLLGTIIYGNNIITYANSPYSSGVYGLGYGSAFLGRNNDLNGTKANSAETIFAVGTGTGFGTRKTGFLIDSGSNTFIEGTLNVSGSTSFNGAVNITGSLTSSLTLGYVWVGGTGNVSTLVATSSFGGVTSAITASSLITASVNLNTITFTKGDSSTFAITVDTGSGGGGSVPAGTVSSSAQILGYNIFATTGSNTYTGYQILKNNLSFQDATGLEDNNIVLSSLNKSTLYIQNTSISSGYSSGSVLQLTTTTGSTGFGSGSTVFQMDAVYEGNRGAMKVGSTVGLGSYVQGFADKIEFAKQGGFPNTPATTFRVDAASIELSGSIKVNTGSSGSAGIVSVDGTTGTTVNNGLVTAASIILATTQELGSGNEYPAVVSGKTAGSFTLNHNFGGSLNVAYLIINPL